MTLIMYILRSISGADPGFQIRGADQTFSRLPSLGAIFLSQKTKRELHVPKTYLFFASFPFTHSGKLN